MSSGRHDSDDSTGSGAMRVPPSAFHKGAGGFRPTYGYQPIPGLRETVQGLQGQGRLRSALEAILAAIDAHPGHPEPLILAIIVASVGRSELLRAVEPFPEGALRDRRLDSIFTVCSQCESFSWASHNCLFADADLHVMNPIGVQCYQCGFVVCRKCLELGVAGAPGSIPTPCPNCHTPELGLPVYPTGRVSQQMARRSAPVIALLFFREGPVQPDAEYLTEMLRSASPDIFGGTSKPLIKAFPVANWAGSLRDIALAHLARMEGDILPRGSMSNADIVEGSDRYGSRICIVKVFEVSP